MRRVMRIVLQITTECTKATMGSKHAPGLFSRSHLRGRSYLAISTESLFVHRAMHLSEALISIDFVG